MKTFAFGLIIGALLCYGVLESMNSGVSSSTAHSASVVSSSPSDPMESCVQVARPQLAISSAPDANVAPNRLPSPSDVDANDISGHSSSAMNIQMPAAAPMTNAEAGANWINTLSEQQAGEICTRAHQLRQERERAAKDSEPKDAGWAYSMEQLMRQHIEMHLPADKYTELQVECRTTFCELRMEGASVDGQDLADQVAREIQHQDWSDVVQGMSGGGSDAGKWYVDYEWFRPRTDEERRIHFEIRKRLRGETVVAK